MMFYHLIIIDLVIISTKYTQLKTPDHIPAPCLDLFLKIDKEIKLVSKIYVSQFSEENIAVVMLIATRINQD